MARTSTVLPPYEPTGAGVVNPGTRTGGIIALRIAAALSAVALTAAVRPLNTNVQRVWAALHNWAGPAADRLGHFHHAGPAIHVKASHGWLAEGDRWPWTVGIASAVLLVWVGLAANKLRNPTPGSLAARGVATLVGIVLAVLVVLAAAVWGLTLWGPGQGVAAGVLRGVAWCAGKLQQGAADLISTKPSRISGVTGGPR